jgi:hypothetical protein
VRKATKAVPGSCNGSFYALVKKPGQAWGLALVLQRSIGFDARGGAHPRCLDALGSARQFQKRAAARTRVQMRWVQRAHPSFLCLPKEKKAKERAPLRLVLRYAPDTLRFSAENGRCGTRSLRSLKQSSRSSAFALRCSAAPKGTRVLRSRLLPPLPR